MKEGGVNEVKRSVGWDEMKWEGGEVSRSKGRG